MRWNILWLSAVVAAVGIAAPVLAQVAPNQPPNIVQQLQQNMNNAGVTPRDIIQSVGQQMQDGTFDPQAFRQQLQDSGIINQGMLDQLQQSRNQIQQQQQNRQMVSLQQLLNSPDDEWAVLNVKIQRILDLNTDLGQTSVVVTQRGGGGFGGGFGGGQGGAGVGRRVPRRGRWPRHCRN